MSKAAQAVARAVAELRIKQKPKKSRATMDNNQDDVVNDSATDVNDSVEQTPTPEPITPPQGEDMPKATPTKRSRKTATKKKPVVAKKKPTQRTRQGVSGKITGAELTGNALKQRVRVTFDTGEMVLMPSANRIENARVFAQSLNALVR